MGHRPHPVPVKTSHSDRGKLGGAKTAKRGKAYYQNIGRKGGLVKKDQEPKPEMPIAKPYNPLMDQLDQMLEDLKG